MQQSCYSIPEILKLTGTEEHLQTCNECREIFTQSREFLDGYNSETGALGTLMATIDREKNVKSIDEELDGLPENERLDFIKKRDCFVPGMVINLCNRSKKCLLKSPNESERWLRLAGEVLAQVKQERSFSPKDIEWVEAKYIAREGNLAVARGFITKAHDSFQQARRMLVEIGDDFQVALSAIAFLFTLTKMGRALEAKQVCLEALPVLRDFSARKEYLYMMNNLAMTLSSLSQRKRAERILSMLLRALDKDDEYYNLVIHNLALVQMESREFEKALKYVEEMVEINKAKKMKMEEARAYIIAGEIYILEEEYPEAKRELAKAKTLLKMGESPLDMALINVYMAKIQLAEEKGAASLRSLRDAIGFFSAEGFVPDLIDALELWEKAQKTASEDLEIIAKKAFYKVRTFGRLSGEAVTAF